MIHPFRSPRSGGLLGLVLILLLSSGAWACGKYGPPEREPRKPDASAPRPPAPADPETQ